MIPLQLFDLFVRYGGLGCRLGSRSLLMTGQDSLQLFLLDLTLSFCIGLITFQTKLVIFPLLNIFLVFSRFVLTCCPKVFFEFLNEVTGILVCLSLMQLILNS